MESAPARSSAKPAPKPARPKAAVLPKPESNRVTTMLDDIKVRGEQITVDLNKLLLRLR